MSEPVNVAMLIQGYLPRLGGAERQLAAVAPLLREYGVAVHVLTRRYPGLPAYEELGGVPVHRLPIPGPALLKSTVFTWSALALLRRLRPQLVHAFDLLSPTTTALLAKRALGTPVVVKVLRGGRQGDLERLRTKPLSRRRIAALRRDVDAFMVISDEIDHELAALGVPAERRVRIPNGVDLQRFSPPIEGERQRLRGALGLAPGPLALFSGRLAPEKRVDQLIACWPAVRAARPGAQLLIAGSGPEEARLRALAGDGVRFLGQVDDVAPLLQAADLYVLPSATEGLSNALLEAMAVGLPVVATAVGGAVELLGQAAAGRLIRPDQPAELQAAILELLGDPEQASALGRQGSALIAQGYALPAVAARLNALYRGLLAKTGAQAGATHSESSTRGGHP